MYNSNKSGYVKIGFYYSIWIVLLVSIFYTSAVIPDYINVCKANDRNLSACINNSINHLRVHLKKGIPDLDVPPFEPLLLDDIKLKRGTLGVGIDCNITDLKVWGTTGFVITELKADIPNNKFIFKTWIPHLHFKGNYTLDIRILLINAKGNGEIAGNFTNYKSSFLMKGKKIIRNNQEYLKFDKIRLRLQIGKSRIHLDKLFNNDGVLSQVSNDLINNNSDLFVDEIKPSLENSLAKKLTDIANKIALRFTYKELFP